MRGGRNLAAMRFLDISSPLEPGMPSFPGDPAFAADRVRSIERGDPYNLSSLRLGTHAGTHVDPPLHFVPGGVGVDGLDLDVLQGPCRVVELPTSVRTVSAAALRPAVPVGPRLLLKTSNSARWRTEAAFFPDFAALETSAADWLVDQQVRLVGIDSLSIESDPSGRFPVHHRLLGAGVVIVEGLRLDGVTAGTYDLRVLPLRISGGDGGPARAVLVAP